ncbi:hypothetical protein DL765_002078 [Monosporascus sp. GIB2]|nr:hypothetical protein DL765_002078 [Monosporascus sp. GIB2]
MSQICFQAAPKSPGLTFVSTSGGKLDGESKVTGQGDAHSKKSKPRQKRCTDSALRSIDPLSLPPSLSARPGLLEKIIALYGSAVPVEGLHGVNTLDLEWFVLMDADPVLREVTLAYAATHFSKRNGLVNYVPVVEHKYRAIKMINQRLSEKEMATCNSTLIAVATMANVEQLSGNRAGWRTHLDGLRQMVAIREQSNGISKNDCVIKSLAWILLSSALLSSPARESATSSLTEPSSQEGTYPRVPISQTLILSTLAHRGFSALVTITKEIHDMARTFKNYAVFPPVSHKTATSFISRIASFRAYLNSTPSPDHLIDSFCTALKLYLLFVLSESSEERGLHKQEQQEATAKELQHMLQVRGVRFCSGIEPLLWELFIGGASSPPSSDLRTCFTDKLYMISETLVVYSWSEVKRIVNNVLDD